MKLNENDKFNDLLNSINILINQIESQYGPKLMEVFLNRLLFTAQEYKEQLNSSINFESKNSINNIGKMDNIVDRLDKLNDINMPIFFQEYQKKIKN